MSPRPRDADEPGPDDDVEAQWLEIVARLEAAEQPASPDGGSAADGGDVPSTEQGPTAIVPPADPASPPAEPASPPAGAVGPRAWEPDPEVAEAEDHFDPPDPGPVLGGDPLLTMAWGAVVSTPLLLLVAVVLWPRIPPALLQAAGVVFVLGVALLIWRMPKERDNDGPGAVV